MIIKNINFDYFHYNLFGFVLACTSIIRGFMGSYKYAPTWSLDGKKIVSISDRDGNDEIYIINADGLGQKRLAETK